MLTPYHHHRRGESNGMYMCTFIYKLVYHVLIADDFEIWDEGFINE